MSPDSLENLYLGDRPFPQGQAFRSQPMGHCLKAPRLLADYPQTAVMERPPKEKASVEPSTKDGIEPVRLCASLFRAPPSLEAMSSFFLGP